MWMTLPECTAAVDLTWPVLVGVATALMADQLFKQLFRGHGSSWAVLTQGVCGAWVGAAICQTLAHCTRSSALIAFCALVGSVLALDLCQLVRSRRLSAPYLSDSIKST